MDSSRRGRCKPCWETWGEDNPGFESDALWIDLSPTPESSDKTAWKFIVST